MYYPDGHVEPTEKYSLFSSVAKNLDMTIYIPRRQLELQRKIVSQQEIIGFW
jgi:hypothetical protein